MINFFVPGKPATAGSKKAIYNKHAGKTFIIDTCKRNKSWKKTIKDRAKKLCCDENIQNTAKGAIGINMIFVLERPKFHFNKKGVRPQAPTSPIVKPDVLKLARAVEDALTGVLYNDDAQITVEHLEKKYIDKLHPTQGVEIEIWKTG